MRTISVSMDESTSAAT